jgi:hypothetical protein
MPELIVEFRRFFLGLIKSYEDYFEKINIYTVCGNHGRLTEEIRFKKKVKNNFEYLFYTLLKDDFEDNPKVSVYVSESFFDICPIGKMKWRIAHGDEFRMASSGNFLNLPAMAVSRDILRQSTMMKLLGKDFDVAVIGHFHTAGMIYSINNSPLIFNASIIGGSEYSIFNMHSAFPPSQYAFVCNDDKILCSKLIYL